MRIPTRLIAIAALLLAAAVPTPSLAAPATKSAAKPAAAARKPVLPFIENDYAKAIAEAKARKLPLFVESWAPW
jgi:hypothetical protein